MYSLLSKVFKSLSGLRVIVIRLNRWILPFGGVASGRVCAQPVKQACWVVGLVGFPIKFV